MTLTGSSDAIVAADVDAVVARGEDDFRRLAGRRILLTGGTGFVGSWLLETLTAAVDQLGLDATALVLSRRPDLFERKHPHLAAHPAVRLVKADVRSVPADVVGSIGTVDMIVHGASASAAAGDALSPFDVIDTIVDGMRSMLRVAAGSGRVPFLLLSSGAVYGARGDQALDETYPVAPLASSPTSAYGEAKRLAEVMGSVATAEGVADVATARLFTFVGPHLPLDQNFAVGNFLADALAGRDIEVAGDGTAVRSYLYAADLAAWLWAIAVRGTAGRCYNVGSEVPTTIAELAGAVASLEGGRPSVVIRGERRAGAAPARYLPSTLRARAELGLEETVTLRDALRRTADWHRRRAMRQALVSPLGSGPA
jgi:dTDP-glucose 4,6-dehydratase